MSADSILEVPGEVNEALALVRENRVRLEKAMATPDKRTGLAFNKAHAEAAGKLAQAVKALSTEARLWAQDVTERAGRATPEQRTQAALEHLSRLPQGTRLAAYRQLVDREAQAVQPLGIELK